MSLLLGFSHNQLPKYGAVHLHSGALESTLSGPFHKTGVFKLGTVSHLSISENPSALTMPETKVEVTRGEFDPREYKKIITCVHIY